MSLSRRNLILTAAAAAALPAVAQADDKKSASLPVKKVFRFYDVYLGTPAAERTRFAMNFYLQVNDRPATGQDIAILMPGGARIPLTQGADGRLTRMPTLAEWKDGLLVVNKKAPGDRFRLSMELNPLVRLGETVSTADLHAAIDQCNAAVQRRAGVIGFAVPKMEQVLFAGAGSGQAVAGARTTPLPVFKTLVAYKPADQAGAQSLKFARAPTRAMLAGGKLKG